ncbi:hypothetical protein NQ315_002614 [Exocentrus adspersus]|uniref:Reverse transcriptase n=1 Tax=Exocentrus adspersus TaxID=1586481 RepID=A0AAV8VUT8_9CUCU|nr:hypothetical protein NQ315_002614 [Exocentrus adspersus]
MQEIINKEVDEMLTAGSIEPPNSPWFCIDFRKVNEVTRKDAYCEQDHRKWDQCLPDFQLAINSSKHESTGFSPAFLNFGRQLHLPDTVYCSKQEDPEGPPEENKILTAHTKRLQKLKEVYELVRVNLAQAFTSQSHYYNLRRREWRCHIGDRVMKRENPLSSAAKLAPKYSGPYTVTTVVSPVVYNLKSDTGRKLFHIHIIPNNNNVS